MLSQTAEYALRAVCALASRPNELIPTSELAKSADVPPPYLAKVLQQLASAGLIKGRRGVGGGYKLFRDASDITMLDVVNAVSVIRRGRSQAELGADSGFAPLDTALDDVSGMVITRLGGVTVAQVRQQLDRQHSESAETGSTNGHASSSTNGGRIGSTNGHSASSSSNGF
ncbi:MAG: Rrf2 family transcriptional regulator [Planctomycetota bacterium]